MRARHYSGRIVGNTEVIRAAGGFEVAEVLRYLPTPPLFWPGVATEVGPVYIVGPSSMLPKTCPGRLL